MEPTLVLHCYSFVFIISMFH